MKNAFTKDPGAVLDYEAPWAEWLAGDTISTSTWDVPSGLTMTKETRTTTTATVWLAGGTLHETYTVTNRIVTAGGRTDERSFTLYIAEQ